MLVLVPRIRELRVLVLVVLIVPLDVLLFLLLFIPDRRRIAVDTESGMEADASGWLGLGGAGAWCGGRRMSLFGSCAGGVEFVAGFLNFSLSRGRELD